MALPILSELSRRQAKTGPRYADQTPHDVVPDEAVDEDDNACPICMDELVQPDGTLLPPHRRAVRVCPATPGGDGGHVYHRDCYEGMRARGINRCPECRNPMRAPIVEQRMVDPATGALRRVEDHINRTVEIFVGPLAQERLTERRDLTAGSVAYFDGPHNNESLRRLLLASGVEKFYQGETPNEWMRLEVHPNGEHGRTTYTFAEDGRLREKGDDRGRFTYQGEAGQEALRKFDINGGGSEFYDGAKDNERKYMARFPDGSTEMYWGEKGQESLSLRKSTDGVKTYYTGPQGQERYYLKEYPDRSAVHYTGPSGQERMIKLVTPQRVEKHFEGPKDEEYLTKIVRNNRSTVFDYNTEPPSAVTTYNDGRKIYRELGTDDVWHRRSMTRPAAGRRVSRVRYDDDESD